MNLLFIEGRGWTMLPESGPRVDVVPEAGDVGIKEGKVYRFVAEGLSLKMVELPQRGCKEFAGNRVRPQGRSTTGGNRARIGKLVE